MNIFSTIDRASRLCTLPVALAVVLSLLAS
jgi:hypothetical protein